MRISTIIAAGAGAILVFGAGFSAGYVYNETYACRLALDAAKSVAAKAKTALEATCEQQPDLKRCALLKLQRPNGAQGASPDGR